jgi:uncharacterized protein (DUF488 family)
MKHGVYSLGTSTRSMKEFLDILKLKGITQVCDVRSFPSSKRYPHFSSRPMAASLQEEGITYLWLGKELGGYRKGDYKSHMETPCFNKGLEELESTASEAPTAFICAELLPWRCHRRFIASALQARGWKVIHILDASKDWVPQAGDENLSLWEDDEI